MGGVEKLLCPAKGIATLLSERLSEAVALRQVHKSGHCDISRCADAEIMLVSEKDAAL